VKNKDRGIEMRSRDKNPILKKLITSLEMASHKNRAPVWKALARGLNRPGRVSFRVNLYELERFSAGETLAVPGKVLGGGEVTKPFTVAALNFSSKAREAIEKAGGKALSLRELMEKNPGGGGIRIVG
jgi:large subunit ribosomal protein L18e